MLTRNFWGLSTTVALGPRGTFYAFYGSAGNGGGDAATGTRVGSLARGPDTGAQQAMVSYTYRLSRRTMVYSGYNYIRNDANATYNFYVNRYPVAVGGQPERLRAGHRALLLTGPAMIDQLIIGFDRALRTLAGHRRRPRARSPGADLPDAALSDAERRHAAGLMRVNHTGEVCAQALYAAQALVARDPAIRAEFAQAAREEEEHLAWTQARLAELDDRTSLLNPLWYAGSFAIGVAAGLAGDRVNLGFVVETERQVEEHLTGHIEQPARRRPEEPRHRRADARRRGAPRRDGARPPAPRRCRSRSGGLMRVAGGRDARRRLPRLAPIRGLQPPASPFPSPRPRVPPGAQRREPRPAHRRRHRIAAIGASRALDGAPGHRRRVDAANDLQRLRQQRRRRVVGAAAGPRPDVGLAGGEQHVEPLRAGAARRPRAAGRAASPAAVPRRDAPFTCRPAASRAASRQSSGTRSRAETRSARRTLRTSCATCRGHADGGVAPLPRSCASTA